MLIKPNLDELLPRTDNRYTLAMLVARRARQLIAGAEPMHTSDTPNMVTLSCEEVAACEVVSVPGRLKIVPGFTKEDLREYDRASDEDENEELKVYVPLTAKREKELREADKNQEETARVAVTEAIVGVKAVHKAPGLDAEMFLRKADELIDEQNAAEADELAAEADDTSEEVVE